VEGGGGDTGVGGPGVVIIKQNDAAFVASGVWSLSDAYNNKKAGTWS